MMPTEPSVRTKLFIKIKTSDVWKFLVSFMLCGASAASATPPHAGVILVIHAGANPVGTATAGTLITLDAFVYPTNFTGQVAFCEDSATSCTDIHLIGLSQITTQGHASLNIVPTAGTHTFRAIYLGTNLYPKYSTTEGTLIVTPGPGGSIVSKVGIQASGTQGNYTLLGTVTTNGANSPTGTVSFLDTTNANYTLGSAGLSPTGTAYSFGTSYVFPERDTTALASSPRIVVADFNGDGIPDMVLADPGNSSIEILLGKGDGTFTSSVIVPSGGISYTTGAVVGDFNQDGKVDFAAATSGNGITVWLGNGDGTFVQGQTYPVVGGASDLIVGDFDRDGVPDIAYEYKAGISVTNNYIQVLHGNGDGTFSAIASPTQIAGSTYVPVVADFNNDGKLDIAVIDPSVPAVDILLGNGNGTFTLGTQLSQGLDYTSMVAADFNDDGNEDLVVCNRDGKPATVFLGHGDGTFTALASGPNSTTISLPPAVGDFNGDSIPDLIFANGANAGTSIFLGKGDGTFTLDTSSPSQTTGFTITSLAVADFNSDGLDDVAEGLFSYGLPSSVSQVDVQLSQASNTAAGYAYNISPVGTGYHYVIATYPGDANNPGGTSSSIPLLAQRVTTALSITTVPVSRSTAGQPVTITATLSQFFAQNHYASGSVTFYNGAISLGQATVTNGVASLTTSALPTGALQLSAYYPGDTNFTNSTSTTLPYFVGGAAAISFTGTPNPVFIQNPLTLAAIVSGGVGAPSGTVQFVEGGTLLGTSPLVNGSASLVLSNLSLGAHILTAIYSGDGFYSPLSSAPLTITVEDYSLSVSNPNQTIFHGGAATYLLTVNSVGGSGTASDINFSVTGAPDHSSISFSPNSVPQNSGPTNVTLVIQTPDYPVGPWNAGLSSRKSTIMLAFLAIGFAGTRKRARKALSRLSLTGMLLVLLCISSVAFSGCGSGWGTQHYNLTITASSGQVSRSVAATLATECTGGRSVCPIN